MKESSAHTHSHSGTNKPAHSTLMVGIDWLTERSTEGMEKGKRRKRGRPQVVRGRSADQTRNPAENTK